MSHRREWSLRHEFYRLTPGRYELICWTCGQESHRAVNCLMKWGLPPDFNDDDCTRSTKLNGVGLRKVPIWGKKTGSRKQNQGNTGGLFQK